MSASCSAGPRAAASRETRSSSSSPQLPPPLLPAPRSASSPPERTSQPTTIVDPREQSIRRSPVDALNENRARSHTAESSNDLHPRIPRPNTPKTTNRALPVTPPTLQQPPPPPPSHEIPPSPQTPALATQLPSMVLPPQTTRRSPSDSSVSPEKGRTLLPSVPKSSSSEAISTLPSTTISHRHGQDSMHVLAVMDDCQSGHMKATSPYLNMSDKAHMNSSHLLDPGSTAHFSPVGPFPTTKTVSRPATTKGTTPLKSRRVRTGCLTCRERHLKCDEGVPDCFNCKKGNRECKRGLRLNFIDIQAKPIPYVPPVTEWDVSFLDESRLIASEYAGGLARYPRTKDRAEVAPRDAATAAYPVKRQQMLDREDPNSNNRQSGAEVAVNPPPPSSFYQTGLTSRTTKILPGSWHQPTGFHPSSLPAHSAREPTQAGLQALLERGASGPHSLPAVKDELMDRPCGSPFSETSSISSMVPQGMGPSSVASFQADIGNSRTSVETESVLHQDSGENTGLHHTAPPEGLPTPPYEKTGLLRSGRAEAGFGLVAGFEGIPSSSRGLGNGEREYLDSPDEVLYMQVFVEDVGVWMDALDKDMHFSRIIPYLALKSPMMLNAFLACGIKRLALVDAAHQDGKAQYYYDTATTQLLLSLKNPDRDVVECATTAVVLNVYETMSDKPSDRMMHDVGARTLILDCGWNSRSKGIGSACFWLNIGMEILSCLAFNWQMAWEPDQWGLDTSFTHAIYGRTEEGNGHGVVEGSESSGSSRAPDTRTRNPQNHGHKAAFTLASHADTTNAIGVDDETWVHRIYYIVAKIANFRARAPRFQEPSPHDEQARLEHRHSEWKRLRDLCDMWNRECPQSMHPFGYLYPTQSAPPGSVFPNIWLVKRTAIIGRLCYHTAKILLHQVNPADPFDSPGNLAAQRHHARQVCGIVAHTKDRGVTDLAIRSLAISAHVLTDVREQDEVLCLLRKMSDKTGCRTDKIYDELQHVWGRGPGPKDLADATLTTAMAPSPPGILPPPYEPLPVGGFASAFGAAHNTGSGPALPIPFSWYRGSMVSLSPSATQLPPPGPGSAGCLGRPHHMRMYSTASMASNTSLLSAATAGSSPHLSPLSAAMPYRHPIVNPLMHTDASLPGHPYYLFYRRPNVSSQNNSQSQAC